MTKQEAQLANKVLVRVNPLRDELLKLAEAAQLLADRLPSQTEIERIDDLVARKERAQAIGPRFLSEDDLAACLGLGARVQAVVTRAQCLSRPFHALIAVRAALAEREEDT